MVEIDLKFRIGSFGAVWVDTYKRKNARRFALAILCFLTEPNNLRTGNSRFIARPTLSPWAK